MTALRGSRKTMTHSDRKKEEKLGLDPHVLDDGIRDTVVLLQQGGFRTFTSCEGGRGHAFQHETIGIELEGQDDEPYADVQYRELARLIQVLRDRYPGIGEKDVVGHCDVAPGRKTDPGPAFDWEKLNGLLA